eukprot:jgi/Ulvmu1/11034/UM007_0215.1
MSDMEDNEEVEAPPPPKVIQNAELDTQYNLPIRAEKFSIGLCACPAEGNSTISVDLSGVMFASDGRLVDAVYYGNPSAANGALRHCGSNPVGSTHPDDESEIIHAFPALIPEDCDILVFVVGGEQVSSCSTLSLAVHAKERKKGKEAVVRGDILPVLSGNSAVVALTIYRSGNGWLALYPGNGLPADPTATYWGSLVPAMKRVAAAIPSLESATNFVPDDSEIIAPRPKSTECALGAAAATSVLKPAAAPLTAEAWPALPEGTPEAPAAPGCMRIDVGWQLWKEEDEGTDLQYQLVFTTATGEIVECGEEQGVVEGIRGPPEGDGEEEEEAAEEGQDGAAAGGGDEAHPAPQGQDTDPHGFPLKTSFYIKTAELPARVRAITVQVTNFGGAGMANAKALAARVVDATNADPVRHRDLFVTVLRNGKGEHGNRMIAVLAKVHKENADSPFAMLRDGAARSLQEYVDDAEAVRGTLTALRDGYCAELAAEAAMAAAVEAEENGEENVDKPQLKPCVWRAAEVHVLDKAEDAATYAEGDHRRTAAYEGQYNALGRREAPLARAVYESGDCYVGPYVDDARHGKGMYLHANKGAFAGDYVEGLRSGKGVMLLPDGGTYTGDFASDKFEGTGTYEYPDGSCYVGTWLAGKKHGAGTYWDKSGGCMVGDWQHGILSGGATYRQPAYTLQAQFTKGIPDGPCTFTTAAFRKLNARVPHAAAAHIRSPAGPVLTQRGVYAIPAGAAADPELDEDGNPVEAEDAPKMPAHPKYDGLTFAADAADPAPAPNTVYPPEEVTVPPCVTPPAFSIGSGLAVPCT